MEIIINGKVVKSTKTEIAAYYNDVDGLRKRIRPLMLDHFNKKGLNLLMYAVLGNALDTAKFLLDKGASAILTRRERKYNAYSYAKALNRKEMVDLLELYF